FVGCLTHTFNLTGIPGPGSVRELRQQDVHLALQAPSDGCVEGASPFGDTIVQIQIGMLRGLNEREGIVPNGLYGDKYAGLHLNALPLLELAYCEPKPFAKLCDSLVLRMLKQDCDTLARDLRDFLQIARRKVVWMLMAEPDVIEAFEIRIRILR